MSVESAPTPVTPLWEVFMRPKSGLEHRHVGSLHAADAEFALQAARDLFTRRGEGSSLWVVPSSAIVTLDPSLTPAWIDSNQKDFRQAAHYAVPDGIEHM